MARGKELFEKIANCEDCHSQRDISKFAAPTIPGTTGGGFEFPAELGFPGKVVSANITPDPETGIGTWTDGEKIRAIREGVSRDGRALFPLMPYTYFRSMSDEDVYSVVAFLNSLPPVKKRMPRTELNFPVNLMIKGAPRPVDGPVPEPDRSDRLKYGKYLVTMANCVVCHTPEDKGQLVESQLFDRRPGVPRRELPGSEREHHERRRDRNRDLERGEIRKQVHQLQAICRRDTARSDTGELYVNAMDGFRASAGGRFEGDLRAPADHTCEEQQSGDPIRRWLLHDVEPARAS